MSVHFPFQTLPGEIPSQGSLPLTWSFQEGVQLPSSYSAPLIANAPQQNSLNDCLSFPKSYDLGGTTELEDPASALDPAKLYEKCKFPSSRMYSGSEDQFQPPVPGMYADYEDLQAWNKNTAIGRNPNEDTYYPSYPPLPVTNWPCDFFPSQNALEHFPQQIPLEPPAAQTGFHPLWSNPGGEPYEEKVPMDFNSYVPSLAYHSPQQDPFLLSYGAHPQQQYSLPGKWDFDEEMVHTGLEHFNNEMFLNFCPLR